MSLLTTKKGGTEGFRAFSGLVNDQKLPNLIHPAKEAIPHPAGTARIILSSSCL